MMMDGRESANVLVSEPMEMEEKVVNTNENGTVKSVRLISSDGQAIEVPLRVAYLSKLVKGMIDETEVDQEIQDIPLPNVSGNMLKKIIEFSEHYIRDPFEEIEKPPSTNNLYELVDVWYADYVKFDQETLFEMILAANYLDIKPLLDLTCTVIATMIRGKSAEDLASEFKIPLDFTMEEEAVMSEQKETTTEK